MLIVDRQHGHYYVNLPKCGCSSIKVAIAEQLGVEFADVLRNRRYVGPDRIADALDLFGWSVVRNPFARLVSCWSETQPPYFDRFLELNPDMNRMRGWEFGDFIGRIIKMDSMRMNAHYRPMIDTLRRRGRWLCREVYYLERIDEAWPTLQERFGLPALQHRRKGEHRPYQEMYTPELRRAVEERYGADLETFGYDFDGPTREGDVSCVCA